MVMIDKAFEKDGWPDGWVNTEVREKAASLFKGGSPVDSLEKVDRLRGISQSWPPEGFVLYEEVQGMALLTIILKALSWEDLIIGLCDA